MDTVQEDVVFEGPLPMRAFIGSHGLLYLLIVGWNLGWLVAYIRSFAWKVRITSQRLVVVRGLISQREEDLPLYRATDCGYNQTIAGRLLGTGTIVLVADDATTPRLELPFVKPAHYKELIRNAIMVERARFKTIQID